MSVNLLRVILRVLCRDNFMLILNFLDIAYPAIEFSEEGSHMDDSSDFMLVFFVERSNTPSPIIFAREKILYL